MCPYLTLDHDDYGYLITGLWLGLWCLTPLSTIFQSYRYLITF